MLPQATLVIPLVDGDVEFPQTPEDDLRSVRVARRWLTSWCMCVVTHGYGGFGGVGMEVVNDMHAGQSHEGWSHVGRCRSIYGVLGDTPMTPDHTAFQVSSSR